MKNKKSELPPPVTPQAAADLAREYLKQVQPSFLTRDGSVFVSAIVDCIEEVGHRNASFARALLDKGNGYTAGNVIARGDVLRNELALLTLALDVYLDKEKSLFKENEDYQRIQKKNLSQNDYSHVGDNTDDLDDEA